MDAGRETKRRKVEVKVTSSVLRDASISPPPKRLASAANTHIGRLGRRTPEVWEEHQPSVSRKPTTDGSPMKTFPSPVQLNFIEELPASSNIDTVSLGSILGDPMIKECWLFNYLFDMNFVMFDHRHKRKESIADEYRKHFDPDTRDMVQVKVVHGSWKREDPNGIGIEV